ncbi:MAG: glycosyltransferase family 2 protein [Candidatus Microsaccharimonas sp.]
MTRQTYGVLYIQMMLEVIIYIADAVLAVVLVLMGRQIYRAVKHVPHVYTSRIKGEVDLPSVTVCIPARNETHALTDCLQRVLASTYERLEIIVLDDVSTDDTPALIRSFASEGVRFVKGTALPQGWLGKNHALQGLLHEASGSYVLFMDVDTVLAPNAIENMVRHALSHRLSMLSVLPRREDGWRFSVLAAPLRYFWELLFKRPASPGASSNAWLVRRSVMHTTFNGFHDLKNAIQPESKIAATLARTNEYEFLIGSEQFGVGYEKKWTSQLMTSVRLLYPLLNKEMALAILAVLDLALLLVPFVALVLWAAGVEVSPLFFTINALLAVGFMLLYGLYTRRVWRKGYVLGALLWPLLIVQEISILIASVIQYKRKAVTWKGRLIRPEAQN